MLASANKKNEDTNGNGSAMNSQFWGAAGVNGWGDATGNVLADFLLKDMTWGFAESTVSRSAPQRWRDFEAYAADSWQLVPRVTLDYGVRYSLFYNPYTTDDKITSFVPSLFNPALGAASCNGLVEPPDKDWCAEANALGGSKGPNRSLMTQDKNNIAPRVGIAWDVFGTGKTAVRGGVGQFFQRERLSPVLNIATNPPFVTTLSGIRKLDSTAEPCDGCFGNTLGAPASGREVDMRTPNTWQWNVMFQHEIWHNTTLEVGYVGSHGYNLLRDSNVNQVYSGDINGNGVDDRLEYVTTTPANGALRRYGVFGDATSGSGRTTASRRITRSRHSSSAASAGGDRRCSRPTRCPAHGPTWHSPTAAAWPRTRLPWISRLRTSIGAALRQDEPISSTSPWSGCSRPWKASRA